MSDECNAQKNLNIRITIGDFFYGSSANLLAVSSLMSDELGERKLNPGDEVITLAAGFPTTVNPIFQNNLTPKFIDIDLPTYSALPENIESAITSKTKAIIFAHTLGNPFELDAILEITKKNNLWLIEDCCDALGSRYNNKHVGTFGDIATFSFYPAHQITMGEGGAVITNNPKLRRIIESLRDWGRDCFCAPGKNDTCGKRFDWKLGDLPYGYDHKYTYSSIGYNLKITDMQASVGLSQLQKLPEFIKIRQENFEYLKTNLSKFSKYLILPTATSNSSPSWFGFPIVVTPDSPFSKNDLISFLSSKLIDTRPLFAGNLTKQPYLKNKDYETFGILENTDLIMNNGFWIGVCRMEPPKSATNDALPSRETFHMLLDSSPCQNASLVTNIPLRQPSPNSTSKSSSPFEMQRRIIPVRVGTTK